MKNLFTYILKVLTNWWVISLALLPNIGDFISNYLPPEINFNPPQQIKEFILILGFFIASYNVWKDVTKENLTLTNELSELHSRFIQYEVKLEKIGTASNLIKKAKEVFKQQTDWVENETFDQQEKLLNELNSSHRKNKNSEQLQRTQTIGKYLEKLRIYKQDLAKYTKDLESLEKAQKVHFTVKDTGNLDDEYLELIFNIDGLEIQDYQKLENEQIPKYLEQPQMNNATQVVLIDENYRYLIETNKANMHLKAEIQTTNQNESESVDLNNRKIYWRITIVKPLREYTSQMYVVTDYNPDKSILYEISSKKVNSKNVLILP